MKRALIILFVVAMSIPIIQSCKKGPDDPFLSCRTRKARLVGNWTLKEGSETDTWSNGNIVTWAYDGSSVTRTNFGGSITTLPYTESVNIRKDGTYKKSVIWGTDSTSVEGVWFFGRKSKELDIKNKETVWFTALTDSNGYDPNVYTGTQALNTKYVWLLDELKNKEIIVTIDGTLSISGSNPDTYKGTMTYVQK